MKPEGKEGISNGAHNGNKEERIDLEELENFAQTFKKQRIKFGFTQGDVGMALGRRYGTDFSQTTISRFEALNLSFKNMCKLRPLLKEWLADAEAAIASGASVSDLLEGPTKNTSLQVRSKHFTSNMNGSGTELVNGKILAGSPSPSGVSLNSAVIPLRKRRKRTNLDASQRAALDQFFKVNPRPDHDKMAQIAEMLELDRDVIRVWFCNRRQKVTRSNV
uniref:POU domain protein n=1 Tax=Syphacia muris TaxID=451379 RepID=A0A0N5AJW4_9BILA